MIETDRIEFKQSWRDEYLEHICGMANAEGGSLFIGLDDNGAPVGIAEKDIRKLLEDIPNKIVDGLHLYNVKVRPLSSEGKYYIEIVVPQCNETVSLKGKSYIRIGTTTRVMGFDSYREALMERGSLAWDSFTVDDVSIDDLDEDSFRIFKTKSSENKSSSPVQAYDRNRILEELNLIRGGKLTRAAVLLFHRKPDDIIPGSFIRIGKMESGEDVSSKFELHGSLMRLSQEIFEILETRYLSALISYNGNDRIETYPYPELALREAIFNSLMHSDWSAGEPILIRVFNDSLDISNRALLQPGWSIDEHRSFQLNPLVSETFEKAGFVEKFGTGISKIISSCKENGNRPPAFEVTSDGKEMTVLFSASNLYVAIEKYRDRLERKGSFVDYRKVVDLMVSGKLDDPNVSVIDPDYDPNDPDSDPNLDPDSVPENVTLPTSIKIPKQHASALVWDNHLLTFNGKALVWSDAQRNVYELIKANQKISYSQIAAILQLSRKTVSRNIANLREKGLIQFEGKPRNGEWKVLKEYPKE